MGWVQRLCEVRVPTGPFPLTFTNCLAMPCQLLGLGEEALYRHARPSPLRLGTEQTEGGEGMSSLCAVSGWDQMPWRAPRAISDLSGVVSEIVHL